MNDTGISKRSNEVVSSTIPHGFGGSNPPPSMSISSSRAVPLHRRYPYMVGMKRGCVEFSNVEKFKTASGLVAYPDWTACLSKFVQFLRENTGFNGSAGHCSYRAFSAVLPQIALSVGLGTISANPDILHGAIYRLVTENPEIRLISISTNNRTNWLVFDKDL